MSIFSKRKETETSGESKGNLPIVTKEILLSAQQSDTNHTQPWGERLEATRARMVVEQPVLVRFIEAQLQQYPPESHQAIFEVVVGLYSLLEQQAMTDNLSFRIKLPKGK